MVAISKYMRVAFEIANELYTAVGAGALGMVVLLKHGFQSHQTVKTLSVVSFTVGCLLYVYRTDEKLRASKKKIVFITGCDSGLGYSLAQHAADLGFTVFAGFLCLESKGAKEIRSLYGGKIVQIKLDITENASVEAAVQTLEHYFGQNPGYRLHAIINNAGVMVFGEFEWLTERIIQQQVNVNLVGTFRFSNAMCPLLRQHKGRMITIISHCSQAALPGLAVYGATKAALNSWNDALRVEMAKYGVSVLTFLPGSFVLQSSIMARQLQYVQEMHDSFTPEQHSFYSSYFKRYNIYLSFLTPPPKPIKIEDEKMYKVFECTLLDRYPKVKYKHETFKYWFYHLLFNISPWYVRDRLVTYFMQMPKYNPGGNEDSDDIQFSPEKSE